MSSSVDVAQLATVRIGPAPHLAVDHAGEGELLLFLHGIGGNRSNWSDQLSRFSSRYLAAAWDTRGYGLSDDYDGPFEYADVADDVIRVIRFFGKEHAHLVGLSMGGRILVDLHARHPEVFASLILVDTFPGQYPSARRSQFLSSRQQPLLEGGTPADVAPEVARTLVSPNAVSGAYERLVKSMSAARRESYLKAIKAGQAYDRWSELANIRVPTQLIVGKDDQLTTPEDMKRMADAIPGCQYSIIPNAGHLSNIEQPEAFDQCLDRGRC